MEYIKDYFANWKTTYGIAEVEYYQPIFIIHMCYLILSITISLFFSFTEFLYMFTPYFIINLIPTITLMIRRLNELNVKPFLLLLWLIPIIGWLYISFILLSEPWEYETSKTLSVKDYKDIKYRQNDQNKIYKKGMISRFINLASWSKLKK
jgi:hypothetical protein